MKKTFVLFFLFLLFSLHAASLRVVNNSSYTLTASIYSADDEYLGSLYLRPKNASTWRDSYHNLSDWTKGPYTVVFTCPNGSEYGKIKNVNESFTVYARQARGPRRCEAK